jgi:hypothetical protein
VTSVSGFLDAPNSLCLKTCAYKWVAPQLTVVTNPIARSGVAVPVKDAQEALPSPRASSCAGTSAGCTVEHGVYAWDRPFQIQVTAVPETPASGRFFSRMNKAPHLTTVAPACGLKKRLEREGATECKGVGEEYPPETSPRDLLRIIA